MKIRKPVLVILFLICILVLSGCGAAPADEEPEFDPQVKEQVMLGDYEDLSLSQIANKLENKPTKTYEDFIDWGTTYLWTGEYLEAAEKYETAARLAHSTSELVGALYNKSVALGYAGYMTEALRTTDLMAKLQPENTEVAWLRYALYAYSGDPLGLMVANDHLVTLDPSLTGEEILDPVIGAIIIATAPVIVMALAQVATVALVPPEDRKEVVIKIMEGYWGAVNNRSDTGSTFGRGLLETYMALGK